MKRSMNPGFAGIGNELFFDTKTKMLFGDAKASLNKLISETRATRIGFRRKASWGSEGRIAI